MTIQQTDFILAILKDLILSCRNALSTEKEKNGPFSVHR